MLRRLWHLPPLAACLLLIGVRAWTADSAVVFMYHHVASETPRSTSVSPQRFREHMAYFEQQGFSVLPLLDAVRRLRNGDAVPERSIVLTFDDGYESVLAEAVPELERRGWPYTVFVAPQSVDEAYGGYLSWSQLREIVHRGGTIGNHTLTHSHLVRRQNGESAAAHRERVRREITAAGERLTEELPGGGTIPVLAYPYGEYDETVVAVVSDLGLIGMGQHSGAIGNASDWLALPRFPVAEGFDALDEIALRARTRPLELTPDMPYRTVNEADDRQPVFVARVPRTLARRAELACYATGQGRIESVWQDDDMSRLHVRPNRPLGPGRTKINCTVPHESESGVYLWFGKLWMTRLSDGRWYTE